MTLKEGKALLAGVQGFVVAQQVRQYLDQHRPCPQCGQRHTSKDTGNTPVKTVFGPVQVPNPRWNRCSCQTDGPRTFRPMRAWLQGRTTPGMLYLETRWASLIPFARVADLLKDVPDGPITVGIDGGYVRAAHKQGWFEDIAGKSVVAFRREGPLPRYA